MNERASERTNVCFQLKRQTNEPTNQPSNEGGNDDGITIGSHSIRLVHFHQIHSIVSILEHSLATTFARWIEAEEKSTYSNDSPGKLIPKCHHNKYISFVILWANETKSSIVPPHCVHPVHTTHKLYVGCTLKMWQTQWDF